ncbi:MAG: type II toxin-antitoxin system HicB family antitoxin [Clostridiales bacterium]|nr:type II toxin-antitoxin system HicB family antitoxin [Clostridiales bacterium]MCD8158405.1 type II toxin-antitoxin system HicB family antitoxin [Clostridiales bacterium]
MPKYEIIIYWSDEDNSYISEVPELPGCMSDGKTLQETVNNTETVIKEWIETALMYGEKIPEPKGKLMYA